MDKKNILLATEDGKVVVMEEDDYYWVCLCERIGIRVSKNSGCVEFGDTEKGIAVEDSDIFKVVIGKRS